MTSRSARLAQAVGPPPNGFAAVAGDRGLLWCRSGHEGELADAGFGPDAIFAHERLPDAEEAGREPLGRVLIGGVELLARRFTHGGLARVLTGRRFRDPDRPFAELKMSERLRLHGVATPRVFAARAVAVRPFGYELTLVTERVTGSIDVGHLLGGVRRRELPKSVLRRAIVDGARLIAAMHDVGFRHADLQPANLLVARPPAPPCGATALDLDGSRFADAGVLSRDEADRNLARLWRHVRRRETEYGRVLEAADIALFLKAYGFKRSDAAERAAAIEEIASQRRGFHRLGWMLERTLGRRSDPRAALSPNPEARAGRALHRD